MDGFDEVLFAHEAGCPDTWVWDEESGSEVPWVGTFRLMVPEDRTGWAGAMCGSCGQKLIEET